MSKSRWLQVCWKHVLSYCGSSIWKAIRADAEGDSSQRESHHYWAPRIQPELRVIEMEK